MPILQKIPEFSKKCNDYSIYFLYINDTRIFSTFEQNRTVREKLANYI